MIVLTTSLSFEARPLVVPGAASQSDMLAAGQLVLAALLCGASALQLPTQLSRRSALALLPFGVAPLVFGPTLAQARVKEGAADDYLARASGGKP